MPSEYQKWQSAAAKAIVDVWLAAGYSLVADVVHSPDGCRIGIEAVFPRAFPRKPSKKPRKPTKNPPKPPGLYPPKGVDKAVWKSGVRVRFRRFDADNVLKACMDALQVAIREGFGMHYWDDKSLEIGRVDRWYAAVGEEPHIRVVLEPLEVS
jgi:hypothetical protein